MKNFVSRRLNLFIAFLFIFNVISCGGGSSSGGDSEETKLEKQLTNFNTSLDSTSDNLVSLSDTLDQLNEAIAEDDGSSEKTAEIKELVDQFANTTDQFIESIESMDQAEAGIQDITGTTSIQPTVLISTVVGAGLVIYGLYSFGKKMKEKSDSMIEARKKRDSAAEAVMNNEEGALDDFEDAKEEMAEIGQDAVQELTTKVTTDLIMTPLKPLTTTGVILKDMAGNALQEGLKVMSSTEECEDGVDADGCKIGVDVTDSDGRAAVPEGKTTIVVGGKDISRIVVEKEIPADTDTEVTVEPIPVEDAAEEMIPSDDSTGDDSDNDGDSSGDDNNDNPVTGGMTMSYTVAEEDSSTVTYLVSVAVTGVSSSTTVTISVENASTSGSQKTLSADGTVIWSVIVLEKDAYISVKRSDTGDQASMTLPGKTVTYDGMYEGYAVTTYEAEDCWCWDSVDGIIIYVSGTTLSGDVSGTLNGNAVSGVYPEYGLSFSGTISGSTMSGTWSDPQDGCCSGTFTLTKQ